MAHVLRAWAEPKEREALREASQPSPVVPLEERFDRVQVIHCHLADQQRVFLKDKPIVVSLHVYVLLSVVWLLHYWLWQQYWNWMEDRCRVCP